MEYRFRPLKEEEDRVYQFIVVALRTYRRKWNDLTKRKKKEFENDPTCYQAYSIVLDLCKLFKIKTLGDSGTVNTNARVIGRIAEDVRGMINDNQNVWDTSLPEEVKSERNNDSDIFIGGVLGMYFTKEYELSIIVK
ncbi:hypothetical protein ES702_04099 [subsurface metagenome]